MQLADSELIKSGALDQMVNAGRSYRKKISIYFVVICLIFLSSLVIYFNYYRLYTQYNEIMKQLSAAKTELQNIKDDSINLTERNSFLEKQNVDLNLTNIDLELKAQLADKTAQETMKKNIELFQQNQELVSDNIQLQNTLKMAASVGIKPQNYTLFQGLEPRMAINRGSYIGKFTGTAYTPSAEECGNDKGITNSGLPIIPGISVAVDKRYWPFGTVFYIKGLGYCVAMDIGSAIKGRNRFDFAVFDRKFANILGLRKWDVYLIKKGNGKITNNTFKL